MQTVTLKKWGNSVGVIIPHEQMKATGAYIGEKFTVISHPDGAITLKPLKSAQEGWTEALNAAVDAGAKTSLLDVNNQFDEEEWTW